MLDLGSGAGIPGLVLGALWPHCSVVLVEASARRSDFLRWAVSEIGLGPRVRVDHERAEEAGRGELRGWADLVTARAFGRPAATAECGAPLLGLNGMLIVSDPPEPGEVETALRWPAEPLAGLGLAALGAHRSDFSYHVLRLVSGCPERYPRRVGVPAKRPLF